MSQIEFNNLLASLAGLSPDQLHQLRHRLDSRLIATGPPARESAFDVLDRVGLIGCLAGQADSPTDLATNPAHMDGFGRD